MRFLQSVDIDISYFLVLTSIYGIKAKFDLEEHGDELLIVDVAVSVQVRLLYQLLDNV